MSGFHLDPRKLRKARLERGLSQRALAQLAGVRAATVHAAEHGTQSHPSTVARLASAMQLLPKDLGKVR